MRTKMSCNEGRVTSNSSTRVRVAGQVIGFDKILFGSDYPLIPPARYFKEMDRVGLDAADRRRICGENACRLLGL